MLTKKKKKTKSVKSRIIFLLSHDQFFGTMGNKKQITAIRKKQTLEVGKRYRGSATMNEYGEFDFRAYQKQEENENAMRKITEGSGENYKFAIYSSPDNVKVALLVPRGDSKETERRLKDLFIKTLLKLSEYEI